MPVRDLAIFAVLSTIMYVSRFSLQWIPFIQLLGPIIAAVTLAYRVRALIPIYVYIMLDGMFSGFSFWWLPYLYIWLPMWLMFMFAGKLRLPYKVKVPLYMVLCALHGLAFGIMYAPAQALMFGLSFEALVAWVIMGLSFDVMHAIGNFAAGVLIIPLSELLKKLSKIETDPNYVRIV
jgi:energy-coupling factor transport system substrate-specific component